MDTLIIGSGINGLVAAAELALKGQKVLVVESLDRPGGAVRTEALTLDGFRHDVAAMNLSMFAGSGFAKKHETLLRQHGLEFVPVNKPFASAHPDGHYFGVSTDLQDTLATIREKADRDTWVREFNAFSKRAEALGALLSSPMNWTSLSCIGWKTFRSLGRGASLDLLRLLFMSPREWACENFTDPFLQAAVATWGLHLDFAPDISGGAVFPYLESFGSQAMGLVIGKGGSATITNALISIIQAQGGEIRCNARVQEILTAGDQVSGVRLENGDTIAAKRVIANLAPSGLQALLPHGTDQPRFDKGLRQFRHAPGTMMIHLALSDLPAWKAHELREFAYVHLGPSLAGLAQTYQQAQAGLLPSEPVLVVGQPTVFDPSRAPEGKHTLWVQVRCLPAKILGDAKAAIEGNDWTEIKEAYADRVIALIERYAPDLSSRILKRTVVSPLDLQADNSNLVGGDQISGSHHLAQNFLFRPVRGFADGSTPIKGLYMASASVWPGAGTGAGAGQLLAKRLS